MLEDCRAGCVGPDEQAQPAAARGPQHVRREDLQPFSCFAASRAHAPLVAILKCTYRFSVYRLKCTYMYIYIYIY